MLMAKRDEFPQIDTGEQTPLFEKQTWNKKQSEALLACQQVNSQLVAYTTSEINSERIEWKSRVCRYTKKKNKQPFEAEVSRDT